MRFSTRPGRMVKEFLRVHLCEGRLWHSGSVRTGRQPALDDLGRPSCRATSAGEILDSILKELRRANLVVARRGNCGGYHLGRPASEIRLADVFRPLEGPLAEVHGLRPEEAKYKGSAESLQTVWVAVRASLRFVLEETTIADIVNGRLPNPIRALAAEPDSWTSRPIH